MKVPCTDFAATIHFYEKVIGLAVCERADDSVAFWFGSNRLWIDSVPTIQRSEVWLEIRADDIAAASDHLERHGVERCDEIESLPEGLPAFWIKNPAGVVHLVSEQV